MTLILWTVGIYLLGYIFAYIGLRLFVQFFEEEPWRLEDRFECLKLSIFSWLWLLIGTLASLFYYIELINKKIKAYIKTLDMKKKVTW